MGDSSLGTCKNETLKKERTQKEKKMSPNSLQLKH